MSLVNVINVIVVNPKSSYSDSIAFEIFFEALQPLQHSKSQSPNFTPIPIASSLLSLCECQTS